MSIALGVPASRGLPGNAVGLLVVLMASWGFQLITVKLALPELSPAMQSLIRAVISTACLTVFMALRGERIVGRDATLWPGVLVGTLFAVEFLMIFGGMALTTAARGVVFVYTMPFFVTVLAAVFLPGERLDGRQVAGMVAAFGGIAVAFGEGFVAGGGLPTLLGDLLMIGAAAIWGATTIVIKRTALRTAPATRVLWYQLALSIPVSAIAVLAGGDRMPSDLSGMAWAVIAYQGVWVAFLTYIVWFWLIARHSAPVLSVFTFLTPLFGVGFGHLVLGEPVGWTLAAALGLVAGGIVLVTAPKARG